MLRSVHEGISCDNIPELALSLDYLSTDNMSDDDEVNEELTSQKTSLTNHVHQEGQKFELNKHILKIVARFSDIFRRSISETIAPIKIVLTPNCCKLI